jgi:3-hydroxyisobutyrate dehydrogenase/glyoxylate/succinic semialdehyde reductase
LSSPAAAGWRVTGLDLDDAANARAAKNNVAVARTMEDLAAAAPTILVSLPHPAAVLQTAHADAARAPRTVVELSTLAIADKEAFAAVLNTKGHIAIDCPISGTGAQAAMRDLALYASGPSDAIAALRPIFADFARAAHDLGAYGNGSRMKFVANHLVAIHNVATAEAMLLAERAGLDPKMVVDMVGPGAGGSRMFQMRAPMMVEGIYEPATMKVKTWQKDMAIIAEFAEDLSCATPLFALTAPVYTQAMAMGLGDQDTAAVFEVLKKAIIK